MQNDLMSILMSRAMASNGGQEQSPINSGELNSPIAPSGGNVAHAQPVMRMPTGNMTGQPTQIARDSQRMPVVPPNPRPSLPQHMRRFINGQQIQDAYRNNWEPNPVLLRAQLGR